MENRVPQTEDRLRGFWALIVTQFQGAFSDNLFQWLARFMLIGMAMPFIPGNDRATKLALVGGLFSLSFLLFSMAGGYLADRYSKRNVTIGTKIAEILVMSVALLGLFLKDPRILLITVFMMGTQSAFFGPSKYGILPELLSTKRLSWGNGIIELGTFSASITGTICAGWLYLSFKDTEWIVGLILIALAAFGLLTSLKIDRLPAANPEKKFHPNFLADLWRQLARVRKDRVLTLAILGNAYFWFLAAMLQQYVILPYGEDLLGLNEAQITLYLNAAMLVGLGLGSYAAGYLSGSKIEYGLIPLGALGMTIFGFSLAIPDLNLIGVSARLALYGFFAGFFIVPITALIQHRPDRDKKGATIASSNWLNWFAMLLAAGISILLISVVGLSPREMFSVTTVMTLVGTIYALWLLPDAFIRFVLWIMTRTIYRLKIEGRDNIPEKGGALFVCNHLGMIDALLLQASTDRTIRFMMFKGMYEKRWIKPLAKVMGVIPISSELRPREMIVSLRTATRAIENGEVVCIFAEGQITRIGHMLPFRRGFEKIMKGVEAPIIPVCLDGVWGSLFSFEQGRFIWKWPRRIPYPVTICFGESLPPNASHIEVRQAVQDLTVDAWHHRESQMETLDRIFIRTARKHPFRFAMADRTVPGIKFGAALSRSVFLARRLKETWKGQEKVGILLPPSVAGALVNYAALLLGKVPVNLNYTLSNEVLQSCADQCELKTVITSGKFLEKLSLTVPEKSVLLEDLAAKPGKLEGLLAMVMAHLLPARLLEIALGRKERTRTSDLATVIFSSGSTGDPKGVLLSHYNLMSNIQQLEQVFAISHNDRFVGILPFFHSFGFGATICMPIIVGNGTVYHPNPLDAPGIGKLIQKYAATFLLATPTFLQLYLRICKPAQLESLKFVVAGAEKLPDRLADAFEEKFGVRPLEGYGCTECSPGVAINTHDFREGGFRQVGGKQGKIGHPLPGMSVRIVDESTMFPRPIGEPGLLLVKGPNIMQGYLGNKEKTREVMHEGWYITGDVATMDEDGFLQITDRLSRFSKIGGEMVPHIKVEEQLQNIADAADHLFVVAGVPDEKKGERLVVLHTLSEDKLSECLEKLKEVDIPNIWKPKADAFYKVDQFPYLGTGKLDLKTIKTVALERAK